MPFLTGNQEYDSSEGDDEVEDDSDLDDYTSTDGDSEGTGEGIVNKASSMATQSVENLELPEHTTESYDEDPEVAIRKNSFIHLTAILYPIYLLFSRNAHCNKQFCKG